MSLEDEIKALNSVLFRISTVDKTTTNLNGLLQKLEEEFHATMPDVCPLCGGKYDG